MTAPPAMRGETVVRKNQLSFNQAVSGTIALGSTYHVFTQISKEPISSHSLPAIILQEWPTNVLDVSQLLNSQLAIAVTTFPTAYYNFISNDAQPIPVLSEQSDTLEFDPVRVPDLGVSAEIDVAIQERLLSLREAASEDDITWNPAAEHDALDFLGRLSAPSRPAIAIDHNGDLRLLWENMLREQVGIRFKGNGKLEAVLFQRTEHGMRREIVTAKAYVIVRLIKEMKLVHVTRG